MDKEKQHSSAVSSSSSKEHEKKAADLREKVGRNREKCEGALKLLEEETKGLMLSFETVETRRKTVATDRCEWTRALLKVRRRGKGVGLFSTDKLVMISWW